MEESKENLCKRSFLERVSIATQLYASITLSWANVLDGVVQDALTLGCGAVEMCSIKRQTMLLWRSFFVKSWFDICWENITAWVRGVICGVRWRRNKDMGQSGGGSYLQWGKIWMFQNTDILPFLCQHVGYSPFLSQQDFALVHKTKYMKTWPQSHRATVEWTETKTTILLQRQCLSS